jgi:high-affinity iron transporter
MILNRIATAIAVLGLASPLAAQDPAPIVRRIAATAQLAAQEYALGVKDGRVVATAEVEEARLFLTEAARAAAQLPAPVADEVRAELEATLALVKATAPAESVTSRVAAVLDGLSDHFQLALDPVPVQAPSLARGAAIYQASCAQCHGDLGHGDGRAAVGLNPPPRNLADPSQLEDASPLDFFRRTTIGVAGTAMPAFEQTLSDEDRWAVAYYASTLRLPAPGGVVPPALTAFATTARMSDAQLLDALGEGATLASVAAVRTVATGTGVAAGDAREVSPVFAMVRAQVDSAYDLALAGQVESARQMAFDAYLTFEQVEREVRARNPGLAAEAEAAFTALRDRPGVVGPGELRQIRRDLYVALEKAERAIGDEISPLSLFVQSFLILLREGLEAILVIGALMAFLVRTGATNRRRDIHIGVGMAVGASLLTAVAIETVFLLTPASRELLEGATMAVAAVMLFYVSYWLLTRLEVGKWNRFVKAQVQEAVTSGSALALASVAFLAVYREGFETVLFYQALVVTAGAGGWVPILGGILAGGVVLAVVYVLINRFGVRLPLKPFFTVTSAFLYYMAFVFAGKAVAELQASGAVGTTPVGWAPRLPALGIYPTAESLIAQGLLVVLAVAAMAWIFVVEPSRARRAVPVTPVPEGTGDREVLRSLERIDADLAEARAEVERLKERLTGVPR